MCADVRVYGCVCADVRVWQWGADVYIQETTPTHTQCASETIRDSSKLNTADIIQYICHYRFVSLPYRSIDEF